VRAALLGVFLAACGGGLQRSSAVPASPPASTPASAASEPAAPAQATEAAIVKLQQLSDAMCACADRPCSERVIEGLTQWGQALAGTMAKETEDQARQLTAINEHLTRCLTKLSPATGEGAAP
jgi:hypothetical protein